MRKVKNKVKEKKARFLQIFTQSKKRRANI